MESTHKQGIFFTQHYILYPHKDESGTDGDGSSKEEVGIPVMIRTSSISKSAGHVRTNSRFVVGGDGLVNTHHHD